MAFEATRHRGHAAAAYCQHGHRLAVHLLPWHSLRSSIAALAGSFFSFFGGAVTTLRGHKGDISLPPAPLHLCPSLCPPPMSIRERKGACSGCLLCSNPARAVTDAPAPFRYHTAWVRSCQIVLLDHAELNPVPSPARTPARPAARPAAFPFSATGTTRPGRVRSTGIRPSSRRCSTRG